MDGKRAAAGKPWGVRGSSHVQALIVGRIGWNGKILLQACSYHSCTCRCRAYIGRQLLPTDMRDWKAAGVLAYTVDDKGVHVLLGRIDQRSSLYRPREDGWWILGEAFLA